MRVFWTIPLLLVAALCSAQTKTIKARAAVFLKSPVGWVMENDPDKYDGLPAVLYRKGASWAKADTVMFAKIVAREKGGKGFTAVIDQEGKAFKMRAPHGEIKTEPSLKTADKKDVVVKRMTSKKSAYYDVQAYVGEPIGVVLLVLSARTEQARDAALPAFRELVKSYAAARVPPKKPAQQKKKGKG